MNVYAYPNQEAAAVRSKGLADKECPLVNQRTQIRSCYQLLIDHQ